MNITFWVLQSILAAVFLGAGAIKVSQPLEKLGTKLGDWVHDMPLPLIRAVGALEIAAAAGLILPRALDIAPGLTGPAALGLALTMVGAIVIHGRRGEHKDVVVNVVLALLAVVVAIGRI